MSESRKGWRCSVCVLCGRCFDADGNLLPRDPDGGSWKGERCEVCVGCGKCAQAWGLVTSNEDVDAVTGPTNWADAFKVMDDGSAGAAPAVPGAPGEAAECVLIEEDDAECDAVTGATPGVASACKELGLDDMAGLACKLGIKPPGQA